MIAILACGATTKEVSVNITTCIEESGKGLLTETYKPLPNTLVIARGNIHGGNFRKVELTDQNGEANISVRYTHFFNVSVVPPCGYYSTTPIFRDMTSAKKAEFGFWPANPNNQLSYVQVLVWNDLKSNGTRDSRQEIENEKIGVSFKIPEDCVGNDFNEYKFIQYA